MKDKFGVMLTTVEVKQVESTRAIAEHVNGIIPKPIRPKLHKSEIRKSRGQASPQRIELTELTYRRIAQMFAKALPIEGDEFSAKIDEYLTMIKRLPIEAKIALKMAYIFGSKAPSHEREDLFQDIAFNVVKARLKDERLAYAIARCDWRDFWKRYSIRQHYSLDSVVEDDEGNPVTLAETIVGEVEFENKMDGKLDAERIWNRLPDYIKPLVFKRLILKALNSTERVTLHRWISKAGYQILLS